MRYKSWKGNRRAPSPFFFMIDLIAKKNVEKGVLKTLDSSVRDMGFEIIKIRLNEGKSPLLEIFLDSDSGNVTIDDCAIISKKVSLLHEVEKVMRGSFTLEVSSPGINRPVTKLKHLKQCIGQKIYVKTSKKFGNKYQFTVKLLGFNEDRIFVQNENASEGFTYNEIIDIELRQNI